ncbi:MAG: hypothetical protein HC888_01645 [Candidatus Competibacteraceae bacterium]|nr:hypothetical protein [Candidatus Competibacteraceae bacterium]
MDLLTFPNVRIVGMHFRGADAKEAAAGLQPGQPLRLEREPENQFDGNAIKVYFEDLWLGYVEASQAAWIAPNMDEDRLFTCTVQEVTEEVNGRGKINYIPLVEITEVESA